MSSYVYEYLEFAVILSYHNFKPTLFTLDIPDGSMSNNFYITDSAYPDILKLDFSLFYTYTNPKLFIYCHRVSGYLIVEWDLLYGYIYNIYENTSPDVTFTTIISHSNSFMFYGAYNDASGNTVMHGFYLLDTLRSEIVTNGSEVGWAQSSDYTYIVDNSTTFVSPTIAVTNQDMASYKVFNGTTYNEVSRDATPIAYIDQNNFYFINSGVNNSKSYNYF